MTSGLHRLWKLPLPYALWLALPLQLIMVWVAHQGWTQYRRNLNYRYEAEKSPPFDLAQWRYFTQLELNRSLDLALAPPLVNDGLEAVYLTIDGRHLSELNRNLPESGKSKYYPAEFEVDGENHRVKARYVGDSHWHWLYPQKSWKIKTKSNDPIRDRRYITIKNTTTPMLEDHMANRIAVDMGLMAPEWRPVKFFVNGAYAGLFHWQDVADESLLRRFRRMPGSLYSGDGVGRDGYDENGQPQIFINEKYWNKASSRNAEQLNNRADITAFIAAINNPDGSAFRAFADEHFDLDKFATHTALDRLLGGHHHDSDHNHKIYFDPYKGRFEPLEWDLGWWATYHRLAGLDQVLNPLLIRTREQPELELGIQRKLYDLMSRLPPEEMANRIDTAIGKMRQALASDGFRDVRKHNGTTHLRLAETHCAHFSMADLDKRIAGKKNGYRHRYNWLRKRLADSVLEMKATLPTKGVATIALKSSGLVGQQLRKLTVRTTGASVELIQDRNRNGVVDANEQPLATAKASEGLVAFDLEELVLPGQKKGPEHRSVVQFGPFALIPSSLRYAYFLRPSSGKIESVKLDAFNAVTGESVNVPKVRDFGKPEPTVSFHPWDLPLPIAPYNVTIGPGEIPINENMTVEPGTTLTISPGTTIRLAPDVSIEIRGKVIANGTAAKPIRVLPAVDGKPWGVFALHGIGTKGSRFAHCEWRDGSTAELRMVLRTGMVSIIDTEDIQLHNCYIGKNHVGDDALHFGYVTGGEVRDCEFEGARSDAFDIDITEDVRVVGCVFHHSGNDALDLMTSKVDVSDCHFHDTGDKGISVGEATTLHLYTSKFERCVTGVEIKDRSVAYVDSETRILDCQTGVNLYRKNTRYSVGGTIIADDLWVIGSPRPLIADKRSTTSVGKLRTTIEPN